MTLTAWHQTEFEWEKFVELIKPFYTTTSVVLQISYRFRLIRHLLKFRYIYFYFVKKTNSSKQFWKRGDVNFQKYLEKQQQAIFNFFDKNFVFPETQVFNISPFATKIQSLHGFELGIIEKCVLLNPETLGCKVNISLTTDFGVWMLLNRKKIEPFFCIFFFFSFLNSNSALY